MRMKIQLLVWGKQMINCVLRKKLVYQPLVSSHLVFNQLRSHAEYSKKPEGKDKFCITLVLSPKQGWYLRLVNWLSMHLLLSRCRSPWSFSLIYFLSLPAMMTAGLMNEVICLSPSLLFTLESLFDLFLLLLWWAFFPLFLSILWETRSGIWLPSSSFS